MLVMPYDAYGLFSNTPPQTGRRVCGADFNLGEFICDDASIVFQDCPVSVCHTDVVDGLWLQPVRQDDVARVITVHGCVSVVLEARGALRKRRL